MQTYVIKGYEYESEDSHKKVERFPERRKFPKEKESNKKRTIKDYRKNGVTKRRIDDAISI